MVETSRSLGRVANVRQRALPESGSLIEAPRKENGSMAIATHQLEKLNGATAEEVLGWGLEEFHPRMAISAAFLPEDMVVIDLAHRINSDVRVFTLDTGRLPQETYDLIDLVRGRYDINIEVMFPDAADVEAMTRKHGLNLFYKEKSLRLLCCHVRKVIPLERALSKLDAWVTGLRAGQNVTRADIVKVEVDHAHGDVLKLNPIADWSKDQVWDYIRSNNVPYSALYDQGYTSVGCAPCTRPIQPGEDDRAGRWWWEPAEDKECGLHHQSPSEHFQEELAWVKAQRT
jgi:thioredoxin-dependent adenylylsulfate APS reductase